MFRLTDWISFKKSWQPKEYLLIFMNGFTKRRTLIHNNITNITINNITSLLPNYLELMNDNEICI